MEQELTIQILDKLNLFWDDLAYNKNTKISYGDLILAILNNRSLEKAATELGSSTRTLERITKEVFHPLFGITSSNGTPWKFILLELIDIRLCASCNIYRKISTEFHILRKVKGSRCKFCEGVKESSYTREYKQTRGRKNYNLYTSEYKFKALMRKKKIKQATPKWEDITLIKSFYKNRPEGYHVDHIIPLNGKLVSGLHTLNNLQYLSASDNLIKSNQYGELT